MQNGIEQVEEERHAGRLVVTENVRVPEEAVLLNDSGAREQGAETENGFYDMNVIEGFVEYVARGAAAVKALEQAQE